MNYYRWCFLFVYLASIIVSVKSGTVPTGSATRQRDGIGHSPKPAPKEKADRESIRAERLKLRLDKTGEKPIDLSTHPSPPESPESPAEVEKQKADKERVKELLAEYRQRKRSEIEEKVKKQANDQDFQAQVKVVKDAREAHPEETKKEEESSRIKSIPELNANISDSLFQGDIDLNVEQAEFLLHLGKGKNLSTEGNERPKRGAMMDPAVFPVSLWQYGYVPYSLDSTITDSVKTIIRNALQEFELNTCLWFEENPSASQRIVYKNMGTGCNCNVGKQSSGTTNCNIGPGCDDIGIVMHETQHGLGQFHEHNRYDRESWIHINAAVINATMGPNWVYWYELMDADRDETTYSIEYDTRSIMHYGSFTHNNEPAMVSTQGPQWQNSLGGDWLPTFHDYRILNKHFCGDWCDPETSATCYSGGYPDPYNCSRCICPRPTTGNDCYWTEMELGGTQGYAPSGVPNTCQGKFLWATSQWTYLNGTIGIPYWKQDPTTGSWTKAWPDIDARDAAWCDWLIWTDSGRKIVTEVLDVGDRCTNQCNDGFTSVRVSLDWGNPELRLCCKSDLGSTNVLSITSKDEHTIYSLEARNSLQRFSLRFKMV